MIVNTPDGQVSFPDSMSADDIQGVLRQKYGAPGAAPTSPAAPAADPSAPGPDPRDPSWKPTGNAFLDFLTRPRATSEGVGQAAADYGRTIGNAATFNLADRGLAALQGTSLADQRAASAAARDRVGPIMAPIAEGATYAMGPGGLVAGGLARAAGRGAITEGAIAGGLYGAGSANDVSQMPGAAGVGALAGGGAGLLGAGAGRALNWATGKAANAVGRATGMLDNPSDVTAAAEAARDAAYDTMKATPLDIGDTRSALQNIRNSVQALDPTGGFQKNAPRAMSILDNLQDHVTNNNSVTAHDLLSLGLDKLRNIPDTAAAGGENELKGPIQKGIENFLESGPAAGQLADAKAAHQTFANAKALEQWQKGLNDFGTSPANAAQDVAQSFYSDPAKKAQYDALANIANAGGGGQTAWGLMHAAHEPIDMAAAAAGLGHMAGPVGAAVSYGAVKPALGALLKQNQKGAVQSAIANAYPALTGRRTAFQPDLSPAVKALLFGGLGGKGL